MRQTTIVHRFVRLFFVLSAVGALLYAVVELGLLRRQLPAVRIAELTVDSRSHAAVERYLSLLFDIARDAGRLEHPSDVELDRFLRAHPTLAEAAWHGESEHTAAIPVPDRSDPVALNTHLTVRFAIAALSSAILVHEDDVAQTVVPASQGPPPSDAPIHSGGPVSWRVDQTLALPHVGLVVHTFKDAVGDQARTNLLVGVGMFVVLVIVAGWVAARLVTRPLLDLQHGARRVAGGDSGFRIEVTSNDEVGELARDFNLMSEQVAERERELRHKNQELARASELKTEFLANVSHELRTPLTAIIGFTDILRDGIRGPVTDDQIALLDRMRQNADGLQALIDDLLDISRIEAGRLDLQLEDVPLGECLEAAYGAVEPQLKSKELTFHVAIGEQPVVVRGDFRRLYQVFVNLLGNAVKFTEQGAVDVEVRTHEGRAEVRVRDTGIGIDAASQTDIFEAFRQGDGSISRKYGGAGLGLAVSRKIIELHGGTITVQSIAGQGATFIVTLPLPS